MKTVDEVFVILQSAEMLVMDGDWYKITGFNEDEAYLEDEEFGDETVVSLEKLTDGVDFYKMTKIESYKMTKMNNDYN